MTPKTHIVIDARLYGPQHHTGIGRYTKNLLLSLKNTPGFKKYNFTLIVYPELQTEIKRDLGNAFNYVICDIRHYSFAEQIKLPLLINKLHPDLVHFTHFNKPLLYFGLSVVTVHDLIKHFYRGVENTTRPSPIYWLKYVGYLFLTSVIIKTNFIIVPSNFWREYIINRFHINPSKIVTTHEAIDPQFLSSTTTKIVHQPENYILYTGNLYPHKNIKVILRCLKLLPNIKLKIICARNLFQKKLLSDINQLNVKPQVEFLGFVKDVKFSEIYQKALCLVHPAFMEGFSLTGLEAMALNCPVISSNTSCLPEVYQDAVLYFDPNNETELASKIINLQNDPTLRRQLINRGKKLISTYSWDKTASLTFKVYQQCLG